MCVIVILYFIGFVFASLALAQWVNFTTEQKMRKQRVPYHIKQNFYQTMSYGSQDMWTGTGQTLVKQLVELECFHM